MNINFRFKNINEADQKQLRDYMTEKKLNRLTRLLQHGNLELADLKINAECLTHHRNTQIELILNIKRHKFVAQETGFNTIEAFDIAFDELIIQVRKLENKLHKR